MALSALLKCSNFRILTVDSLASIFILSWSSCPDLLLTGDQPSSEALFKVAQPTSFLRSRVHTDKSKAESAIMANTSLKQSLTPSSCPQEAQPKGACSGPPKSDASLQSPQSSSHPASNAEHHGSSHRQSLHQQVCAPVSQQHGPPPAQIQNGCLQQDHDMQCQGSQKEGDHHQQSQRQPGVQASYHGSGDTSQGATCTYSPATGPN